LLASGFFSVFLRAGQKYCLSPLKNLNDATRKRMSRYKFDIFLRIDFIYQKHYKIPVVYYIILSIMQLDIFLSKKN